MRLQTRQTALPPLPCACANLRRATRAVTQLYDSLLRPLGLRSSQFTLLNVLAQAGPVRQGILGRQLALDSTTLTRTLAPLKEEGWIEIYAGADRRERLVQLTASGRRQLERAGREWERAQKRLRKRLGETDWKELLALTQRVAERAQSA